MQKPIWQPSPNFSNREQDIKYIILHGTWMQSTQEALDRLCDEASEVSCHYLIDEDGTLYQLVKDSQVAWHAGLSAWGEDISLNQYSIGVELSHSGDLSKPYTDKQYETLVHLLGILVEVHDIAPSRILGHSDIAPDRKNDPGPQFNWQYLYDKGVAEPLCVGHNPSFDDLKSIGYVGSENIVEAAYRLRLGQG
jgi:N-acetylmuramoyl-L-alanine amidase